MFSKLMQQLGVLRTARERRLYRTHNDNSSRSDAWNAWRERQALHPRGHVIPVRPAPRRPEPTLGERRVRRASTRAQRARAHRAESLRHNAANR